MRTTSRNNAPTRSSPSPFPATLPRASFKRSENDLTKAARVDKFLNIMRTSSLVMGGSRTDMLVDGFKESDESGGNNLDRIGSVVEGSGFAEQFSRDQSRYQFDHHG